MQNSGRQMFTVREDSCFFTDVNGDFFSLFVDDEDCVVAGPGAVPAESFEAFIDSNYGYIIKRGEISIEQNEDGRGHIMLSKREGGNCFKVIIAVTTPWVKINIFEWLRALETNLKK